MDNKNKCCRRALITTKKANFADEIQKLKKEKQAVILAHNYQRPEIQDIADFVGDSLELSIRAAETDAKIIVFCGVTFMAETAAILNPDKKVLIPDLNALCPMAAMLPAELVKVYRKEHPKSKIVLYINSLAEAKAECDAVCTSSNSAEIVDKIGSDKILFGPDANLARNTANLTGKHLINIPTFGFCPVHKLFNKEAILKLEKLHPDAEVLVHPECDPEVCGVADFVGSTSKMCRRAKESSAKKFIVATEVGLIHKMQADRKDAVFIPAYDEAVCVNMRLHTLEKLYLSLKNERYVVKVPTETVNRARKALDFMLK
jgi:quinolinate synthase